MYTKTFFSGKSPGSAEWCHSAQEYAINTVAHNLLLSPVPDIYSQDLKSHIAQAFGLHTEQVYMAYNLLSGLSDHKHINIFIHSPSLFSHYVDAAAGEWTRHLYQLADAGKNNCLQVGKMATNTCRGIWSPDTLAPESAIGKRFYSLLYKPSTTQTGLRGFIIRSFDEAVDYLAAGLRQFIHQPESSKKLYPAH